MEKFFASNRLSAYLDGDLSETEMLEVAKAIEENHELQKELDDLRAVVSFLNTHGPIEAPPRLHAKVMAKIAEEPKKGLLGFLNFGALRFLISPQGIGIAVVSAAVFLVMLRNPDPKTEPVIEEERSSAAQVEKPGFEQDLVEEPETQDPEAFLQEPVFIEKKPIEKVKTPKTTVEPDRTGVYIPEWDKEQTVTEQIAKTVDYETPTNSDFSYRLNVTDPAVLQKLIGMVEKNGGIITDVNGKEFNPYIFTIEKNYQRLIIKHPTLNLDSFEPSLKHLGGVVETRSSEKLYSGETVTITVEVSYKP